MVSNCIRPVTGCFPATKELWDDTNLPMCVVVTPLAPGVEDGEDDGDDGGQIKPSTSHQSKDEAEDQENDYDTDYKPLSAIPKCLHCGAPHPTKETHFRPRKNKQSILLCFLCGETSSIKFKDQQEARPEETLDKALFDRLENLKEGEDHIFDLQMGEKDIGYGGSNDNEDDDDDGDEDSDDYDNQREEIRRLPAMVCPPVWWIVLDASQTSRQDYWTAIGTALETTLTDIPPYVHVGMVAASSTHLSSWDLSSPVPHVVQYPYTSEDMDLCLVPADAIHATSIKSAVRAAADAHASGTLGSRCSNDGDSTGMPVGLTIELILEYMEQASHPGENPQEEEEEEDAPKSPLKYAGGKILCLLGNPPSEIESKDIESQPEYYQGGVAGACSPSNTEKWEGTFVHESEPTDMTPSNLEAFVEPLDPEDCFETIGTRCAGAAFGVDVLVVVPEYDEDADPDDVRTAIRPFYGLPLLRVLADSSGAPGPLMFGTQDVEGLEENILIRTPWQPGMAFSSELRLRIPPDFSVESTPVEKIGKDKLQIATFLSSGGVAGPACSIDDNLWLMGTCDETTTLTIDLEVGKEVQEVYDVEGIGEIPVKPVIQICFAYTCIEEDEDGNAYTVRKMKVSCKKMPLAKETEEILDNLDTEALMVPLFHKLCLNALQDGLVESQETGLKWLVSFLVCVYQSAMVEQAQIEERKEEAGNMVETGSTFVASERLLDEEGDLEVEDVLLGQDHENVAEVSSLIYALLQCDALRPSCGSFEPSMDGRCAAMSQMASMSPEVLRKCIYPTLQLWSWKKDELIEELLGLNIMAVKDAIEQTVEEGCTLLLDSPQAIVVCPAENLKKRSSPKKGKGKSTSNTKDEPFKLGTNLEEAVEEAAAQYRIHPTVKHDRTPKATALDSFLVEDKGLADGTQDFAEWRVEVASQVQE